MDDLGVRFDFCLDFGVGFDVDVVFEDGFWIRLFALFFELDPLEGGFVWRLLLPFEEPVLTLLGAMMFLDSGKIFTITILLIGFFKKKKSQIYNPNPSLGS